MKNLVLLAVIVLGIVILLSMLGLVIINPKMKEIVLWTIFGVGTGGFFGFIFATVKIGNDRK